MNEGIFELFRGFKVNKTLEKVDISDNQFNTCEESEENSAIIKKICEVLMAADTLLYYDFRFNNISDEGKGIVLKWIKPNFHWPFLDAEKII